ncbi:restriction endonuclease subunit S [Clostridium perfringens]|uniref:restriction endonuclease subunit S n=1 Tax=Clostridium perfringens TaxID=1502 RepID=UPI0013E401EC|nr:restriction endonuclease subunit S [Clostridium perfringens]NGT03364.1 hypothetical protein [Clostridium perfringens]
MKKEVREGYKITELGEIPDDWEIVNTGDIFDFSGGLSISRANLGNKGILYLHYGDIHKRNENYIHTEIDAKWLPRVEANYEELKDGLKLSTGTVVFADASEDYDGIGKSVVIFNEDEIPFVAGLHTIVAKDEDNKLDSNYKRYCFETKNVRKQFRALANGTSVYGISRENIKKIKILNPPIQEQKKIAEILSTVDEQIENTEKLIQKNQELKKGLMQQLLTKGIGHTEFKKTELGEIPKAWEIKKIEKICEILDSKRVPLNGKQRLKMQGDIPYYGANAIVDYINDYIFDDELILIAEDGGNFGEFREKPIAFYVKGKCWVNNHAHVLKAIECENSKWIFYNLVHKDITEIVQGGTRAKLNQKDLRNIKIPFPNLDEQEKIALILSSIDKKIEQYKYKKEKLEELKKGLMKQLLNGNIRVI